MRNILLLGFGLASICCSTKAECILADKDAQKDVVEMVALLDRVSENGKVMFGHQDDTVYGIGWKDIEGESDVNKVTGDYPAVYGWELGHIELGEEYSIDSVKFSNIRREIISAHNRGGINTISWHLRNPYNGESSWDKTPGSVAAILNDEEVQAKYLEGLDRLCDFFVSLKDDNGQSIPVFFRPFHEHTGSWFWWGADQCKPEEYVALWKMTQDYIKDERGIHNIAYIYSPADVEGDKAKYFERYPGDDKVDVLGFDSYHRDEEKGLSRYTTSVAKSLNLMKEESNRRNKPYVFCETGAEGIKMDRWFTEVLYPLVSASDHTPAYVLVWRNAVEKPTHHYAPYPGHPAAPDFVEFMEKPEVLFESELVEEFRKGKK